LRDQGRHLAAGLGDQRLAVGLRLDDAPLGLLLSDQHLALDAGDLRGHARLGLLHQRVGLGLDLADLRAAPDLGAARAAHRREVAHPVADVLDLQVVQEQPHAVHVALGFVDQLLLEHDLLLVDLLGRELGDDAAQVPLQRVLGDERDVVARPPHEALERVVQERLLAGELHVGDGLHVERHAAAGEGVLHRQLDRHVGERHPVDHLDHRHAHRPAAAHQPEPDLALPLQAGHRPPAAGEDEHLVGRADVDVPDDGDAGGEPGQDQDGDDHRGDHWAPPGRAGRPSPAGGSGGSPAAGAESICWMSIPITWRSVPSSDATMAGYAAESAASESPPPPSTTWTSPTLTFFTFAAASATSVSSCESTKSSRACGPAAAIAPDMSRTTSACASPCWRRRAASPSAISSAARRWASAGSTTSAVSRFVSSSLRSACSSCSDCGRACWATTGVSRSTESALPSSCTTRVRSWFRYCAIPISACFEASSARWRAPASSCATSCSAWRSAFSASRTAPAVCARPRLTRYFASSSTRWIFSVSRWSPSLLKTSLVLSSSLLANSIRSSFTCSGVSWETTSRSAPSSVCLAVRWMMLSSTPRKRSTAL